VVPVRETLAVQNPAAVKHQAVPVARQTCI
jgi:hypothetical protein